jgi:hypothetical protein
VARENWRCWTLLDPPPPHRTPAPEIINFGAGAEGAVPVIKFPPRAGDVITNYGSGSGPHYSIKDVINFLKSHGFINPCKKIMIKINIMETFLFSLSTHVVFGILLITRTCDD